MSTAVDKGTCRHGKDNAFDWYHSRTLQSAIRACTKPLVFFLSRHRYDSEQRNSHPEISDLAAACSATTSHLAFTKEVQSFWCSSFPRQECILCSLRSVPEHAERPSVVTGVFYS